MSRIRTLAVAVAAWVWVGAVWAEPATVTGEVTFRDDVGHVTLVVPLSRPVPWKVWLAEEPARVIVEFGELDWSVRPSTGSVSVAEVVAEQHAPGWSRLVGLLREPLSVDQAEMKTSEDGSAVLTMVLSPVTGGTFRELAQSTVEVAASDVQSVPVVVLDPGHGGRDPGAEAGDVKEADLMLDFALVLRSELEATGQFEVVLTREKDRFVHLESRVGLARAAEADVFLSLHADRLSLEAGQASGLTVYALAADQADEAAERQTARHSLKDVLKGVDLEGSGDDVALALMALQQQDTRPRTSALSSALVAAVRAGGLDVNGRPERQGNFAVLKAADVPSVLIELGFLSSEQDLERLTSPDWQRQMAQALTEGLLQWYQEDQVMSDARKK